MAGSASNWVKPTRGGFKNQSLYVSPATRAKLGYTSAAAIQQALEGGTADEKNRISEALANQPLVAGLAKTKESAILLDGTDAANQANPKANLTFGRNSNSPGGVGKVPFAKVSEDSWENHKDVNVNAPALPNDGSKRIATGVIVVEDDGRIWMVQPFGNFAGYRNTFPAGGAEEGLSYQQNARKEAREEMGLDVRITGHAADIDYGYEIRRFYIARRVGGMPGDNGFESASVRLVTPQAAMKLLNKESDRELLRAAAAGRDGDPGPLITAQPNGRVTRRATPQRSEAQQRAWQAQQAQRQQQQRQQQQRQAPAKGNQQPQRQQQANAPKQQAPKQNQQPPRKATGQPQQQAIPSWITTVKKPGS